MHHSQHSLDVFWHGDNIPSELVATEVKHLRAHTARRDCKVCCRIDDTFTVQSLTVE